MVDQLSTFASEVTRVALEVGTQGILGGQARVEGVQGTWADLTRNVNVSDICALYIHSMILLSYCICSENGFEFDEPGAVYLGGHEGRRKRRPDEEDHGRRAWRDVRLEGDGQRHDGEFERLCR